MYVICSLVSDPFSVSCYVTTAYDYPVHSLQVIFRRLHNSYGDRNGKKNSLKLLLHIVSKKPHWLFKIVDEPILKDVLKYV